MYSVLNDVREFLASESWYYERGIPFRRGYLLHGVPGAGKTSLIHSIVGELNLDIYVITLSRRGLDDAALNRLVSRIPTRAIALMEDIDAAFTHVFQHSSHCSSSLSWGSTQPSAGVTLSGLLNAIDGVAAREGRLLFATTNHIERLDPALSCPGRMDMHIEFGLASRWQAAALFKAFYPPAPSNEPTARAFCDESSLADRFAAAVPDAEFSVATLRGHLMSFKTRHFDAVAAFPGFVEKELAATRRDAMVRAVVDSNVDKTETGNEGHGGTATAVNENA
ncbi:P-loop containing nucleoside triphosphate hydrolase protein [Auricularia subglabra TFB-10046 SS5]|uniref:p-loop containing nucleoside triphosphate hydrolase protein n=1 Tax=Auricularia subglabra (strain TFB-10046 / SS5) TaxID=717982 RepID=J0D281_AURST|nr:P-loop containing nucleoside triphosphate hydrolase protein [Auricularia subglabra TFB-10046 SS5]